MRSRVQRKWMPVVVVATALMLAAAVVPAAATPATGAQRDTAPTRMVPTLDPDVQVPMADVLATSSEVLSPQAATVSRVTLNGDAYTVRPGSTGNVFVFTGSGFTASTQYRMTGLTSGGTFTVTNVVLDSPTQQTVTFDVPSDALGLYVVSDKEPADSAYSIITLVQVYRGVGAFFPLTSPARLLDSRVGIGGQSTPLPAGGVWRVPIAGLTGIPATATAVSLNLTAIGGASSGFLSLYPAGGSRPDVSSVNYGGGGKVVPNHVIVPLGQDGSLELYNGGGDGINALIDVDGYYSGEDVDGGRLYWDVDPQRLVDMRTTGTTIAAGATVTVSLGATSAGPLTQGDVADINVTITNQTGVGYASVYTGGATAPNASTHNWIAPGQDTANRVAARVGPGGTVSITNGSTGSIQVIIDNFGSWNTVLGYRFTPLAPRRVADTRTTSKLAVGERRVLDPAAWITPKPLLIVGNLTGDQPSSATFFQLWTGNIGTPPAVSNLNLQAGETRANSFIVFNAFGSNTLNLSNAFGNSSAIIDISGYFDD